jgi:hypothetical protein
VQRLAETVRERAELFGALLQRCDALAKKAAHANAILQEEAAKESDADGLVTFEQTAVGLQELVREAEAIGEDAKAGDFADVARQTEGLRAQLTSAHKKIVAMCERYRQGRVVH